MPDYEEQEWDTGDTFTADQASEMSREIEEQEDKDVSQDAVIDTQKSVELSSLFRPMTEVIDVTVLTTDEYNTTLPTGDYDGVAGTRWDSANMNTQGMNFVAVDAGHPEWGAFNNSDGRSNVHDVVDVEALVTGDKLDISMSVTAYIDSQVYIEDQGVMKKAKDLPLADTIAGAAYRTLRFADSRSRRIRFVGVAEDFIQYIHESSAVVRRSPNRPLILWDGDSYSEGAGAYNAGSARTFATFGIIDRIIELTGFAAARLGQSGTGYFADGDGGDELGTVGANGTSRFFSTDRQTQYELFLGSGGKPVVFIINGTVNDGGYSGDGVVADADGMAERVTEALDWITDTDPYVSIALVGPEPLVDSYVAPTNHTINRTGMMAAVAAKTMQNGASCIYVDANHPTAPFFTGTGSEAAPSATSQQAQLLGMDGLHPNWLGAYHYGTQIVAAIAVMSVCAERAAGRI